MRPALATLVALVAAWPAVTGLTWVGPPPLPVSGASRSAVVTYSAPVDPPARVVARFDPPRSTYAPGHRGVDLAVSPARRVRAAADGVVRFAGSVAGRGLVVLLHADGITTEYEPVRPTVSVGAKVARGAVIGRVLGRHRDCARDRCLHWAARRGTTYLDPLSLVAALGPVRLIPWKGPP